MPLCRLLLRSLLRSRVLKTCGCTSSWEASCHGVRVESRSACTASRQHFQDEEIHGNGPDLSKTPAHSTYLDFILGPEENSTGTDGAVRGSDPDKAARKPTSKLPSSKRYQDQGIKVNASSRRRSGRTAAPRNRMQARISSMKRSAARNQNHRETWAANLHHHRLRAQGYRLQSKYVSVRSGASSQNPFSRYWNVNFARIQNVFDNTSHHGDAAENAALELSPRTKEWVDLVLEHLNSGSGETQVVRLLHKDHKRAVARWRSVALWLLYHSPERMLDLLKASNSVPYPPLSCLEDSLQYLAKYFTHINGPGNKAAWAQLYDVFILIARKRTDQRLWIQSSFFRLLLPHCSDKQIQELYRTLKTRDVKLGWQTYLHFASYFAKHERFEQSLDAILEARDEGAPLDSYAFRSNCATLLRTAIRQPGGLRVTMRIVSNLVKIGLPLNTRLCNIVMLNAVEAGDLKTAFSVYNSLVQNGLEADDYTYSILLKGCRASIDDAETLNTTIRGAIEGANVTGNLVLATEIIHCLALHHTRHSPEKAYDIVLDAYAQLFDTRPLRKLGLFLPEASQPRMSASQRLQPNEYTINIMLATYLDHHYLHGQSSSHIHDIYKRLRTLTEAGEEPFDRLATTDYTANVFLSFFTRTKRGLLHAAEVIKDMQKALPAGAKAQQCPPTVQSWSIFLHGFTRHKQFRLAEQVLGFMRTQGLQPNHVTWTSLIAGHANMQNLDKALDAVRQGEADGVVWDERAMVGLRQLADQSKLQEEFQKQPPPAPLDFTQEIRDGLATRLSSVSHDIEGGENNNLEGGQIKTRVGAAADAKP